jgi:hypothetical protein
MGSATLNERKFPYLIPRIANPKANTLFSNQSLVDMYTKVTANQIARLRTYVINIFRMDSVSEDKSQSLAS